MDGPSKTTAGRFRVKELVFGWGKDKSAIHFHARFTVLCITPTPYDCVANGKRAISWVIERRVCHCQQYECHRSGTDCRAVETLSDARYPLSPTLRAITMSLETMKIVGALPRLVLGEATTWRRLDD